MAESFHTVSVADGSRSPNPSATADGTDKNSRLKAVLKTWKVYFQWQVLVTGGAGYIGSVTVELLRSSGEVPIVLDNLSRGHQEAVSPDVKFYQGDIADRELVLQIARENEIDACIHFAAYAYVGESVENPAIYFENNATKAAVLFGSLIEADVRRIVFSSTCATYGEPKQIPISEDHSQWPANPYGWSKLFVEQILSSYDKAYDLKFVALRYFKRGWCSRKSRRTSRS